MFKSTCVFSGNSNPALAEKIANYLELPIGRARVSRFSDGEVFAEIKENVRGVDVYVIQSTCAPVNDNLMELLVMVDALKRASAGSITAVVPYYGYARQDRKAAPRTPITAKLVADLLSSSGVDRVVSMDLHAGQIQGFFNKPFDHLYAMPVFLQHLRPRFSTPPVFVSPDAGGVERTRAYAKRLDADLAIIDKRREEKNVSEVMHIIGDVDGRECVILDDMIDTAGTMTNAARALHDQATGAEHAHVRGAGVGELLAFLELAAEQQVTGCRKQGSRVERHFRRFLGPKLLLEQFLAHQVAGGEHVDAALEQLLEVELVAAGFLNI